MSAVVDVWLVRGTTSVPHAGASSPERVLDEVERARLARLSGRTEAGTYAALHVMTRRVIGERLNRAPKQLRFDRSCPDCRRQHGAPRLLDDPDLRLSLSRTRDLGALALARGAGCGVDVEEESAVTFAGFDDVALHPQERSRQTVMRPVIAWVRKEAALKALGVGFRIDPATVLTPVTGVPVRLVPGLPTVVVADLEAPSGYAGALAIVSDGPSPVVHVH